MTISFWRCKRLQLTQQIFKNDLKRSLHYSRKDVNHCLFTLPTNLPKNWPKTINCCLTSILCVCFETRSLLEHRSFWDFWLELLFLWRLDIFVCEIVSLVRKFVALRMKCGVFSSLGESCFGRDDLFFVELEDLMKK